MNATQSQTQSLVQLRPRSFRRWCALPIFGPHLDDFVHWLGDQGYTPGSIRFYLRLLPQVVRWLLRKRITSLAQLTQQDLQAAYRYYRPRGLDLSSAVRALGRFYVERGTIREGQGPTPSPVEIELDRFAEYLRESRGLAEATVLGHTRQLRSFLRFLRADQDPDCLRQLELGRIDAFLHLSARTNNRFSLQHIVATVRAYLRRQYAQGKLSRTLHLQIDTPRVYRSERLPRALAWTQVQALLRSIDRSEPFGLRDFTLLYMAAAYGLRSGELVRLTLDDLDWRGRTLRVAQTKTKQAIQLPLSDEAANLMIDYLRNARPESRHRQLFLRMRAPDGPLKPGSVHDVLDHRRGLSGLDLPEFGTHVLRHSLAAHLLRQGVGIKTIGDTLGHRDIESTSIYLRLGVDDLRCVALPAPSSTAHPSAPPLVLVPARSLPRVRVPRLSRDLPKLFHSSLASSLQRFLDLKRTLGRRYRGEGAILSHWDDFLHCHYPEARKVRAEMFSSWTQELSHLSPTVRRAWQRLVRNWLLFHARDHTQTFIPDLLTFPKPIPAQLPRLVSEAEMARILHAAWQLPPSRTNPLRAETIALGLLLLFCCGLRRGELLRLKLGDLDRNQGLLSIVETKFHKSRLVPLDPTVTVCLEHYLQGRGRRKLPMTSDAFLLWSGNHSPEVYAPYSLLSLWRRLCVSVKVLDAQGHPPRLHDLRHSFACNALQRWYTQGADVQTKLPHLATYLGHVSVVSTYYYLQLNPRTSSVCKPTLPSALQPSIHRGGRRRMNPRKTSTLAATLHGFFTDYIPRQRALSPHTLHSYRDSLKLLLQFVAGKKGDPSQITLEDLTMERVATFLQYLETGRRNQSSSRNVRLSAIHSFFRYVGAQCPEHLAQVQRILSVPFKRSATREIQHLSFDEIQAVLGAIDRSTGSGRRDLAMLSLMFNTGARVSEIAGLQTADLRLAPPPSIVLRGKGRKERTCPLWPETAHLLQKVFEERSVAPRPSGALFLNHRGQPVTRFGIRLILRKHLREAAKRAPSLKHKRLHPHSVRHSTAVHLLRSGVDLSTIAHWLGHASVNTTNKYLAMDLEAKREALAKAKPLLKGGRRSGNWHRDPNLIAWLEQL